MPPERPAVEGRPPVRPRHLQPVLDVALHLQARQRAQVIAHRDPLAELAQARRVQLLAQLGLAEEDDLQELALVGLQVRQQPYLLQQLAAPGPAPRR